MTFSARVLICLESEIIQQEVKRGRGGRCGGLRFGEIWEDKRAKKKKMKALWVGGLWWVLEEKKQTNVGGKWHWAYAALLRCGGPWFSEDSYPNPPPLNLASPSSSRVLRKTDLSPRLTREKKRYRSTGSTPRLWFKVDISLLSRPYLSSSPTSLSFILFC